MEGVRGFTTHQAQNVEKLKGPGGAAAAVGPDAASAQPGEPTGELQHDWAPGLHRLRHLPKHRE